MNRTNIFITDDQIESLEELSTYLGISRAEVIRRAIDQYVHTMSSSLNRVTEKFAPLPRKGTPAFLTESEGPTEIDERVHELEKAVRNLYSELSNHISDCKPE